VTLKLFKLVRSFSVLLYPVSEWVEFSAPLDTIQVISEAKLYPVFSRPSVQRISKTDLWRLLPRRIYIDIVEIIVYAIRINLRLAPLTRRIERVEPVELDVSSVSSRAVRQARHNQNAWFESCQVETWRAKWNLVMLQFVVCGLLRFYNALSRDLMRSS